MQRGYVEILYTFCKPKTTLKQLKCIRKKKMKTNELQFTPDLTD